MKKTAYKNSGQAGKRVALALMVSIGILLLGVLVMTSMVLSEKLPEEMIHSVAVVLVFAATLMGAVTASAGLDGFWIPLSAFAALEYLLLVAVNVLAFDGGLERIGIGTIAVVLGTATAAALKFIPIASPGKKKYRHRFR